MPAAHDMTAAAWEPPAKAGILATIRRRIASGILPMGSRISDRDIALELGVSRTPVREALVQLQAEGLVEMRPQSGTFVFNMTAPEIRQLCATRAILEVGEIRLPRSKESVQSLRERIDGAENALRAGDLARCDALDCDFHEALVAASGNGYLVRCYRGVADRLRALRQRLPRERGRIARAIAQHRRIVDLLDAAEVERAARELEQHVDNVERMLTALGGQQ
ncbi:MAG: GntR family transcriptional regulator [Pseudorhodoplanes sp.]